MNLLYNEKPVLSNGETTSTIEVPASDDIQHASVSASEVPTEVKKEEIKESQVRMNEEGLVEEPSHSEHSLEPSQLATKEQVKQNDTKLQPGTLENENYSNDDRSISLPLEHLSTPPNGRTKPKTWANLVANNGDAQSNPQTSPPSATGNYFWKI
jgi:hypothetical protein